MATSTPTAFPAPGAAIVNLSVPSTGGTTPFVLASGQSGAVAVSPQLLAQLQLSSPKVAGMSVVVDPRPQTDNVAANGSLGGGNVEPVSRPMDIRLALQDSAGNALPAGSGGGAKVDISLPVLAAPPSTDASFSWLQAIYENGNFLGYVRPAATFDPTTGSLMLHLSVDALQGTLFLPVFLHPAWIQNTDPNVHLYSGPTSDAIDFGLAGPQFTTFTVVAPQVAGRIFVYNPTTSNYGWMDASGVGPSGPPK